MARALKQLPGEANEPVVKLIPEVAEKYKLRTQLESNEIQIAGVPGGVINLNTISLAEIENFGGLTAILEENTPEELS
ncbi:hypothetical protein [Emticicia fontis]